MPTITHTTRSPEETHQLAAALAARLRSGAVLALHGELGAGKTCFIQGLALALGVTRPVTSPTYLLANEYAGRLRLCHLDLYRLGGSPDALRMGLEEYLESDGVTAIAWAERAGSLLPPRTIHVRLAVGPVADERAITIEEPDPC
jgi:tRNA threonylcarbamoyladenosine biosynthesis protein TsaE